MAGLSAMATKLVIVKSGDETEDLTIAHLTSIGEISTEADEIDVTTLDSPNRAKEFIQGTKDSGSIDFSYNDMFDGQTPKLDALFDSGDTRTFKIIYPDNKGGVKFQAYMATRTKGEETTDGLITRTFSARITGDVDSWEGAEPTGN